MPNATSLFRTPGAMCVFLTTLLGLGACPPKKPPPRMMSDGGADVPGERDPEGEVSTDGPAHMTDTEESQGDCDEDQPDSASIGRAWEQLDAGNHDVAISPKGCVRLERIVEGGLVVSKRLTYAGKPALAVHRTTNITTAQGDFDLDGFSEWTYLGVLEPEFEGSVATFTESRPGGQPYRRKTYTARNGEIEVLLEEADSTGTLKSTRRYATTVMQPSFSRDVQRSISTEGCTAADSALVIQRVREAMDGVPDDPNSPGGLVCLHRNRMKEELRRMLFAYAGNDIVIECDDTLDNRAQYEGRGWFDLTTTILVNPSRIRGDSPFALRHLLWHEMMHEIGDHDPKLVKPPPIPPHPRVHELDRTEACAEMCWPTPELSSKCSCATCLGSDVSDPRCSGFKDCKPFCPIQREPDGNPPKCQDDHGPQGSLHFCKRPPGEGDAYVYNCSCATGDCGIRHTGIRCIPNVEKFVTGHCADWPCAPKCDPSGCPAGSMCSGQAPQLEPTPGGGFRVVGGPECKPCDPDRGG
jgi:hypothetical protein